MNHKHKKGRKCTHRSFRSFFLFFFISLCCLVGAKVVFPWFLKASHSVSTAPIVPSGTASKGDFGSSFPQIPEPIISSSPVKKCIELVSYVVKPGDTFLGILSKYGLSSEQAINCHHSLAGIGLFSLLPGDSLVLTRLTSGVLVGFDLLHKLSDWYSIVFDSSDGLTASKRPIICSSQRCMAKGTLLTSLSESMNEMGVDDICVSKFADIFAWDINFFVDPQKGDGWEIIFEKKFSEGRFVGVGDILAAEYSNNGHVFRAIGLHGNRGEMVYFDPNGHSLQKEFLKAPLRFNHISSNFSHHRLHPILGIVRPHLGIDYAAPTGTPVHASADGLITFAAYNGGFGKQIKIRHGGAFETSYGHLQSVARGIRPGKRVVQGDLIGYVGATGLATGPHLDYRMTRNQQFVNPSSISLPAGKDVDPQRVVEFSMLRQECLTMFTSRLPGKTGAFVLDIAEKAPNDSAEFILCRSEKVSSTDIP
jgi:murein DD-endopeptidase MepM/ murein hydrolase activator NlpD